MAGPNVIYDVYSPIFFIFGLNITKSWVTIIMAFISDRHVFVFKNTYVDYDTTYDDEVDCSGDGGGGQVASRFIY